ncbi:AEC family transporter [Ruegeria atlantica]|uniref:AEC family transporter n=1 Tax=Ruegeria atlantica TaxID=81569 RepID=UPI00147F7E07
MQFDTLFDAFVVMLALVGSAVWFRRRNVIQDREQGVFARLVTDFALPALIFANLSSEPFRIQNFELALVLFLSIATVMVTAWLAGRWMRLERPVLGSVILVSGVGSTSTLGYSLLQNIYGDNAEIMSQLVVMGEIGVILPLFTVGVAIASYFGENDGQGPTVGDAFLTFLRSPIFLAFVLGVLASAIGLPKDNRVVALLDDFLGIASASLTFLVAFTIGLMLRPIAIGQLAGLVLLVCALKLILEPVVAGSFAFALGLADFQHDILVVEAAMPSGALAAVIAARYGCDSAIASALLVATFVLSLFALPLIGYLAL